MAPLPFCTGEWKENALRKLSEQGELFVLRAEVAVTSAARAADVLEWAARKSGTDQVPEGLRAQVVRAVALAGEGTPLRVAAEVQLRGDAQPRVARCYVVLGDLAPGAAPGRSFRTAGRSLAAQTSAGSTWATSTWCCTRTRAGPPWL